MLKTKFHFRIHLVTALLAICSVISAQERVNLNEQKKTSFKDHLFYGGGLGLQFGSITLVDISPMIGYKISPRFGVGVSPTYKYHSYKEYYGQSINIKSNVFGGSVFGRFIIFENVFAHAEYELLTYKVKDPAYSRGTETRDFQSVLIGGGYREGIGDKAFMNLIFLWNLNETPDSPYTNPIIRAGFSIGL